MKRLLFCFALCGFAAGAHGSLWTVADGSFTDPQSWNDKNVPTNQGAMAQWYYSDTRDVTVRLPTADWAGNKFVLDLLPTYNGSITFDGADSLFRGVSVGTARTESMPFWIMNGSSSVDTTFGVCTDSAKTHALFSWSNVWWRVTHTSDQDVTFDFARGDYVFGGVDAADAATGGALRIDCESGNAGRNIAVFFTNVTVTAARLDIHGRTSSGIDVTIAGPETHFDILRGFQFGYSKPGPAGVDVFTLTDGSKMSVNSSKATSTEGYFYIGYNGATERSREMVVDGVGTELDVRYADQVQVTENGMLTVTNGATFIPKSLFTVSAKADKSARLRVTGAGSKLLYPATDTIAVVSGKESSCFEVDDGGSVRPEFSDKGLTFYIGQNADESGVVLIKGGELDMGARGGSNVRIGMIGSGCVDVRGGVVTNVDQMVLAVSAATGVTTNIYRQTGGDVYVKTWLSASNVSDKNRDIRVILDGGVLHTPRVTGGGGVDASGPIGSKLGADGGTVRATKDDTSATYPWFSGFASAQLGPKGLTLDVASYSDLITQRFTNKPGQSGRLMIVGTTGTAYFNCNDGDNAELVCASAKTVFQPGVTNWQTTVVVTNNASFSVANCGNLSLMGLSLGNATSSGKITVAPATRIALKTLKVARVEFVLSGTFNAATEYPLLAVAGHLDEETSFRLKSAAFSGSVPSGFVPQFVFAYDDTAKATTVTLCFVQAAPPTVENVWRGATGETPADWSDAKNWSAGVPDRTSIVTLKDEQIGIARTVTLSTPCASLGALAFSTACDWRVDGTGSLFFEDCGVDAALTVSGGEQTVDVPVYAVKDLAVSVAADAKLTLAKRVEVTAGKLSVNLAHETGRTVLAGEGSSFKTGISHGGGVLEVPSAEVFGNAYPGGTYNFKGRAMLRVAGDPADAPYRLPFGFNFHGGSAGDGVWGGAQVIDTDRALVVPPYVTSMTDGGCLVKFGRAPLVFEARENAVINLTTANGKTAWNNATIPQNSTFTVNERTGLTSNNSSFGGVNVYEGELSYRGSDDVVPTAASQAVRDGFGMVVGFRTTNTVAVTPGLVLDRVYADFGATKTSASAKSDTSYVSLAQDAYGVDYPRLATNAYIIVSNGSTLATGRLRVGATTFDTQSFLDVSPRVVVDASTCRVVDGLDFAAQKKVHADWRIRNGSTLLTGTNDVAWAGEANVQVDNGSTLAGGDGTAAVTFALGADARGTLAVKAGSSARLGTVTAADGADVTFVFDGGKLVGCADGGTIAFPSAVTLEAQAGGLVLDIPDGETWNLAKDVTGPGFVTLNGVGTLSLSGTVSAGFVGGGTVSGGTLVDGRIGADVTGASAPPTFDDVTLSGRVKVDLGLGEAQQVKPYPTGVRVATFTGKVPPASAFRLVNAGVGESGRRLSGIFTVADGVVTVDVVEKGLILIVR